MSDYFTLPTRQAAVVESVEHRPWPLPKGGWSNAQTWLDLAFLHWRVASEQLRPLVPAALEVDTRDGSAWLGIAAFRLSGFRLRGLPPLPVVSAFPELNVRTYVTRAGRPGIWFFSLDAGSRVAVEAARRTYRLPYFHARMSAERRRGEVQYDSARAGKVFSARYRGTGDPFHAEPDSLEWFLTERYCLYAEERGTLYRADIHHPLWPLQAGEATVELNTMAPAGVELPDEPPLVHFAARQDVVVWPLERVA